MYVQVLKKELVVDTMTMVVVEGENIYGVAAVTTELVETARCAHRASPTATAALGRLLTGSALLGTLLKEESHRVILQVSSRGPVRRIVAEANGAGHVRGYLGDPAIHVPSRNGKLDVGQAVGKGILHVVKEIGLAMPATGTVPLVSGEIAEDLASYLVQSEQIPSAVSLGVFVRSDYVVTAAGGFVVQFHSTVADDLVAHIEIALAATPPVTTMIQEGYDPQAMLQRALGGLAVKVVRQTTPVWRCRCTRDRVTRILIALGSEELRSMIAEAQGTQVKCEFCATEYVFSHQELVDLLAEATR
jgi:molecular chaperone Hsp33